jgi:hypothetical protein
MNDDDMEIKDGTVVRLRIMGITVEAGEIVSKYHINPLFASPSSIVSPAAAFHCRAQ